jgi:hypothetical protein
VPAVTEVVEEQGVVGRGKGEEKQKKKKQKEGEAEVASDDDEEKTEIPLSQEEAEVREADAELINGKKGRTQKHKEASKKRRKKSKLLDVGSEVYRSKSSAGISSDEADGSDLDQGDLSDFVADDDEVAREERLARKQLQKENEARRALREAAKLAEAKASAKARGSPSATKKKRLRKIGEDGDEEEGNGRTGPDVPTADFKARAIKRVEERNARQRRLAELVAVDAERTDSDEKEEEDDAGDDEDEEEDTTARVRLLHAKKMNRASEAADQLAIAGVKLRHQQLVDKKAAAEAMKRERAAKQSRDFFLSLSSGRDAGGGGGGVAAVVAMPPKKVDHAAGVAVLTETNGKAPEKKEKQKKVATEDDDEEETKGEKKKEKKKDKKKKKSGEEEEETKKKEKKDKKKAEKKEPVVKQEKKTAATKKDDAPSVPDAGPAPEPYVPLPDLVLAPYVREEMPASTADDPDAAEAFTEKQDEKEMQHTKANNAARKEHIKKQAAHKKEHEERVKAYAAKVEELARLKEEAAAAAAAKKLVEEKERKEKEERELKERAQAAKEEEAVKEREKAAATKEQQEKKEAGAVASREKKNATATAKEEKAAATRDSDKKAAEAKEAKAASQLQDGDFARDLVATLAAVGPAVAAVSAGGTKRKEPDSSSAAVVDLSAKLATLMSIVEKNAAMVEENAAQTKVLRDEFKSFREDMAKRQRTETKREEPSLSLRPEEPPSPSVSLSSSSPSPSPPPPASVKVEGKQALLPPWDNTVSHDRALPLPRLTIELSLSKPNLHDTAYEACSAAMSRIDDVYAETVAQCDSEIMVPSSVSDAWPASKQAAWRTTIDVMCKALTAVGADAINYHTIDMFMTSLGPHKTPPAETIKQFEMVVWWLNPGLRAKLKEMLNKFRTPSVAKETIIALGAMVFRWQQAAYKLLATTRLESQQAVVTNNIAAWSKIEEYSIAEYNREFAQVRPHIMAIMHVNSYHIRQALLRIAVTMPAVAKE